MARPYKQPTTNTPFGHWLRQAREKRGWTMNQLAVHAGSATTMISNLERGERHPSRAMALRLAAALSGNPAHALLAAGFAPSDGSVDNGEIYAVTAFSATRERTAAAYNNAPPEIRRAYDALEREQARLLDPFVEKSQRDFAAAQRAETLRRQAERLDALAAESPPESAE